MACFVEITLSPVRFFAALRMTRGKGLALTDLVYKCTLVRVINA
jgi:hypothetical protein